MRVANEGARAASLASGKPWKVGSVTNVYLPLYAEPSTGTARAFAHVAAGVPYAYSVEMGPNLPEHKPGVDYSLGFISRPSAIEGSGRELWAMLTAMLSAIDKLQ